MKFKDLRDFVQQLEQRGELKRIQIPVSPVLEMTEICDRTLRAKGPALLFENPTGHTIPVLGNLFGTPERVAINLEDARIPDNAGDQPTDRPVEPGGPDACFSTLPVKRMALAIREAMISGVQRVSRRRRAEVVVEGDRRRAIEIAAGMAASGDAVKSPMQATVVKVAVAEGQQVVKGDLVVVLEAMKMEQPLQAHKDGVVGAIDATPGTTVSSGHQLLTIS